MVASIDKLPEISLVISRILVIPNTSHSVILPYPPIVITIGKEVLPKPFPFAINQHPKVLPFVLEVDLAGHRSGKMESLQVFVQKLVELVDIQQFVREDGLGGLGGRELGGG